jgi:hypothetical protein
MRRRLAIAATCLALGACGSSSNAPDARLGTAAPDAKDADATSAPAPDGADAAAFDGLEAADTPSPDAADATDGGYGNPDGPCTPGVPRCHGDFGYQMCQQDGTWGESNSCAGYSSNGTTSFCAEIPMDGGGTWATCVDPACWYWLGRGALGGSTPVGICQPDGTIRPCLAGGTVAPAAPCDGVCTQVTTLDGRAVGYCAPACKDDARECLGDVFYRVCAQGRWSPDVGNCGQPCIPVATGARPDIRCGGACDPGTSRCGTPDSVEVCVPGGTWKTDRTCLLGRCRPAGPQAECETECAPGEHQCGFDGAGSERVCDDKGLWMPEAACATGTSCRMSGDVALGCVACVPARPGGGNAFGGSDSRCGGASGAAVETCGDDNQWLAPAECPDLVGCNEISRGASTHAGCVSLL